MSNVFKQVKTLESVIKYGLCTGCGTCAGLCPQSAIEMLIDHHKGIYMPVKNKERCNECGLCFKVCPGHSVNFKQLSRESLGQELVDNPLANHLNFYMGYAADQEIRYNAASGGVITALLISALEDGLIDGALVTKMREDRPLEPQPFIARNKEEIISACKSKYCPVPANIALREIIEKEGKYAVVGLPCHIQGVRKASLVIKELKQRVVLCLSIFCSHNDSFKGTEFLLSKYCKRKDITNIAGLDYRGSGWPGFLTIRFKDNTIISVPFDEYMIFHGSRLFAQRRCMLCCDAVSKLSDITAMDAWLPEIMEKDKLGTSLFITRTAAGEGLCKSAKLGKFIKQEPVPSTNLVRSQGRERLLNRTLPVYLFLRRALGGCIPDYDINWPRPGLVNYFQAFLNYFNGLISPCVYFCGFTYPMARIECVITRAVSNYRRARMKVMKASEDVG